MAEPAKETQKGTDKSAAKPRDGFLKTDFNCYSGLCWHKNWFADLNRYVSVSSYNIQLTLT